MCSNTQCRGGRSSELRPWLRNAVLEKQPATVEFGEDIGGLLNFDLHHYAGPDYLQLPVGSKERKAENSEAP